MAVQTRAALKSDKDTAFADNSAGDISAADLRGEFEDVLDSVYIAGEDNSGDTQLMTAAEKSKLSGIETGADVTDETNVTDALDGATLTDLGTPASGDLVLLQDASDSSVLKVAQFSTFGGAGAGDAWGDAVDADIVPDADGTWDLGSTLNRFAALHVDTIDLDGTTFSGSALSAPGADAIMGYDFSASQSIFYTIGSGLGTSGTTLSADVVSVAGLTGTIAASGLRTALNVEDGAEANDVSSVAGLTGVIAASGLRTALNVADGSEANTIDSDPTGVTGADQVTNVMSLTTAEYGAITPNASTVYLITDA